MPENEYRKRLEKGFGPLGYCCTEDKNYSFEFRNPGKPLRFAVKYCEGGVMLFWTEDQQCDLLDRIPSSGVNISVFNGSPEEFWRAVAEIAEGSQSAR